MAESLESEGRVWNTLWTSYTASVEQARKPPAGSVMLAIDSLPASLVAAQGNPAKWALQRQWVDALKTGDEMRGLLISQGAQDEEGKTFRQVSFNDHLARIKPRTDGDAVGMVVAEGGISDGTAGPGSIGGLSTAKLIRQARDNDKVKALVLRVNSPGGSAFGSELVRRELELTRKAGKPVVVSMGNLAASGGYWISMAADEVIADETTITGSIGVVGLLPTTEVALARLGKLAAGARVEYIATAPGGFQRLLRSLGLAQADLVASTGFSHGLQSLMVSTGLLPPLVQTLSQNLGWLADVADRRKPFAASAHCLCDGP